LRQIRALSASTALLAEDETDLLLFPPLRSGWALRGQIAPVPLCGSNARRTMFATMHLHSGHLLLMERSRHRGSVALLLDEHSTHTDQESQSLAEDLDIQLLWLPHRSPHLNPVDHLWGFGKQEVCANWQQSSIDAQVDQFMNYYRGLSHNEVLSKSGMLSPDFWLHKVRHF